MLHRWEVDFAKHFPDAADFVPDFRVPASDNNYAIQGMHVERDGSLLFNYNHLAGIKLDACSVPQWRLEHPTHHMITPAPDGSYWIPSHRTLEQTPPELIPYPFSIDDLRATGEDVTNHYHDTLLHVAADGRVLAEVSVLRAALAGGPPNEVYNSFEIDPTDLTHLNDVELVTPELAARIDGVEAGQLLVSLCDLHSLAIIDPEREEILWYASGPWVRQHDPDILADGTLLLFNNRSAIFPGSQILAYDPATGAVEARYEGNGETPFFTFIMGTQQPLDNGNMLITETVRGRVFEIDPEGTIVWDYRQAYDERKSALVTEAKRLPPDYFEPGALDCD